MVHSNDWLKFSHDKMEYNVSFDDRKPISPAKRYSGFFYFHSTTLTCFVFHYSWHSRLYRDTNTNFINLWLYLFSPNSHTHTHHTQTCLSSWATALAFFLLHILFQSLCLLFLIDLHYLFASRFFSRHRAVSRVNWQGTNPIGELLLGFVFASIVAFIRRHESEGKHQLEVNKCNAFVT